MSLSSLQVPGNICKVTAHQARGLLIKGKDEANNAFVTFNLNKTKFATSVIERVQNPVWNEECEFMISDYGGTLELVVCHSDFLRERFLGRVEISISGIAASEDRLIKKWYKLQPKKGKDGRKLGDRGQLEVTVQLLYRTDFDPSMVKGHEHKKPKLLNILHSPGWRRKSSGGSSDGRRRDSHSAQEDFLNDINNEMQYREPSHMEPAFYSDDSQSVASSVSDDPRMTHLHNHHHSQHQQLEFDDHDRDQLSSLASTPEQKTPVPHSRFRREGSARGKGAMMRNRKAALGNAAKPLSRDHIDKVGVSTPDLRQVSASLPPTPIRHHKASARGQTQPHPQAPKGGVDEADSGARPVSVHLGVSSLAVSQGALLGASLGASPAVGLSRARSEECLVDKDKREKKDKEKEGYTTLPRGKQAKRENRHKKSMSACITTLSQPGHHADLSGKGDEPAAEKPKESKATTKSSGASKYDTLSKQQLVQLVQQQESILDGNIKQIKELETYIESLLLRVMVESPHLLDLNYPKRL